MLPSLSELLYQALAEPFGLVIESNDAILLRQKLYPLKSEDPALACLALVISPTDPDRQLWIVKKQEKTVAQET